MTDALKTVAIADDEPTLVAVLPEVCLQLGYQLTGVAANGEEAVELVRKTRPNLILLDFHMPVLDGLEATRQIAALGCTAVVLLTGDNDPEIARKAMDLGACGYVKKPFEVSSMSAFMETAWHRFQTQNALHEKARLLDEALELRKLLEKAKGILMEQQGFSEEQSHKTLLKMSQDQGIALKEVCRSVIQVRMILGKSRRAA